MKETSNRTLTPKLRFREFRNDEGWKTVTLGSQGDFLASLSGKSAKDFDNGSATFITYMNVFSNQFTDVMGRRAVNVAKDESQNAVAKGDVFFTVSSETPDDAGMSSVLLENIDNCYLNSFCALFRFDTRKAPDSVFLGYFLRSASARTHLSRGAQGATRYNISKATFHSLPILLPTSLEQQKIADCLGSLDSLIAAEGRKLAALRDHKRGLMQQLFPQPGQTQPRLRFPEFRGKGEWEKQPFELLYDFKPNNTFSRDQLNYGVGAIRNIHYGDIHTRFATHFRVSFEDVPYVNAEALQEEPDSEAFCRPGDVLFADASEDLDDVGKCIEIVDVGDDRVLAGSHTILARPRSALLSVGFAGYLFKSRCLRDAIEKEAQGTKVMQISPKRLSKIDVFFPPDVTEQRRIGEGLSSLDSVITAQAAKIETLKQQKRGLMQQLFPSPEDQ